MQFFDAMAELDHESRCSWEDQRAEGEGSQSFSSGARRRHVRSVSGQGRAGGERGATVGHNMELGNDMNSILWRRSWGGTSADVTSLDTSTVARARQGRGEDVDRGNPRLLSAALAWCCKPVVRKLERRSVDQVSPRRSAHLDKARLEWCKV